jgi:D-alanyl-D-alanine carboxypeptidase
VDGIEGIQAKVSDIEARIAAINEMMAQRASMGWGPGLSGAGDSGPYGSLATSGSYSSMALGAANATGTGAGAYAAADTTGSTSFAQTLASVQGGGAANDSGSAEGLSSSAPPFAPPASLVGYGNGHIPPESLELIGVGAHRLWAPAADAFKRMARDATTQGIKIGATDSYRSYDQQVQLAQRKGLYSEGGLAAQPGQSKHGWGMALDLDVDSRGLAWMRANGARYGFYETTPREPWHWEFRANAA